MRKISILISMAAVFISSQGMAAQSEYLHQPVISTRVMGMGGAFTAVADDYNAAFYNPAGLARLEEGQLNMGIQVGGSPAILSLYSDINGAGSNSTALTNVLLNHLGEHDGSRVGLGGVWARPSWAVVFMPIDLTAELDLRSAGIATIGLQAYQDTLLQFSKAWNLNDQKSFNIGISPKLVYRGYFEKDISAIDLLQNTTLVQASDAQEGLLVDTDFGAMYTPEVPKSGFLSFLKYAKPTFGFAVRNLIDGGVAANFHLFGKQSVNNTAKLERRFDFGSRWDLPEFWVFKPKFMFDVRDVGARYVSTAKALHFGAELGWKAFKWLEGSYALGFSEGYLTAGISGEMSIFRIDLATYAEEVGTSSAPRQSRRYMAKLSLDF